jgi:hypothetical protein
LIVRGRVKPSKIVSRRLPLRDAQTKTSKSLAELRSLDYSAK